VLLGMGKDNSEERGFTTESQRHGETRSLKIFFVLRASMVNRLHFTGLTSSAVTVPTGQLAATNDNPYTQARMAKARPG
jgi:hypothetical protein